MCPGANRRTLGSLRRDNSKFVQAGSKIKNAKHFNNVVESPLLQGDDSVRIDDIFVPPELHLFTGVVNYMIDYIADLTPADFIIDFFKSKNIVRKDYQGGKFEGNQCSRIMEHLDQMETMILNKLNFNISIACMPLLDTLRKFKAVKSACFSYQLSANFKEIINSFEMSYRSLNIPVTPKMHIIFTHVPEFCDKWGVGLGLYSEQASETQHSDFKTFWGHYSTGVNHAEYGEHLLAAVIAYNGRHI